MPEPLSSSTSITIGLLVSIGGFFAGVAKWLFGIKKDVDKHTVQLNILEQKVDDSISFHEAIKEDVQKMSERTARIETKLDLLIEKKIK